MLDAGVPLFSCTWLLYPPSTCIEVIQNIRGYDGKMADVWSAGEHRGSKLVGSLWPAGVMLHITQPLLLGFCACLLLLSALFSIIIIPLSSLLPGVMLYTMLYARYPFERPEDKKLNQHDRLQRILHRIIKAGLGFGQLGSGVAVD